MGGKNGLENSSAKLLPKGTILFTIFATIGKVGILNIEAATNQAIASVQIRRDNVDRKYLFYCLKKFGTSLLSVGRGAAQYNVNQTILKNLKIPLPPLEEQKRIVEYLDQLQQKVETIKKYQEETKGEIEAITQAVLRKAFEGKL